MKVHITLVGGQPAPVYHGIVATQPDKVVFIYSESSRDAVEKVRSEIHIVEDEQKPLDTTDPHLIMERAKALAEKYKEDEVTLNISSGLKSWSHLFGRVFDSMPNASVVYMDQNNVLWNYRTMEHKSDFEFDMDVLFRLYGNRLENYKRLTDYTEEDLRALDKIKNIRLFNVPDFNKLTATLNDKQQNILRNQNSGKFDLMANGSQSYVEWEKTTKDSIGFVRIFLAKKNGKSQEVTFESENAVDLAFNSGWFEFEVATLLSKWAKAKSVYLNCHFPFRPNVDKNEVDIIVNTGTKILFVECKTQITHTTDIDKFRSVVKGYGGTGSKGLFVTDARMTDVARKKCEEHGLLSFSLQDDHLGMSHEKALALLLDSELFNINTK
ncbi:MAG: DUF1887 family protein [Paludibacteraceae bacterium]|nr:DUF1887 family protein [Paludibacteraceae bacterium]